MIVYSSPHTSGIGGPGSITGHDLAAFKRLPGENVAFHKDEGKLDDLLHDALVAISLKAAFMDGEEIRAFHAWSNAAYFSFRECPTDTRLLVARASSHPDHQAAVLKDEYKRWGVQRPPVALPDHIRMNAELGFADDIIIPSEHLRETFPKEQRDKARVIEFGSPKEVLAKPVPDGRKEDLLRGVFLGSNVIRKGLYYVEKAWTESTTAYDLLVANVDPQTQFPEVSYRNILHQKWLPPEGITQAFQKGNLFLLPSLEEGQAIAVWEAMAWGLPVVLTKECGHPIEDGKQGFLVPPRSVNAIKKALTYFKDNPSELKRMGREARAYAQRRTWDDYEADLLRLWEA